MVGHLVADMAACIAPERNDLSHQTSAGSPMAGVAPSPSQLPYPGRVLGLVLCGTSHRGPRPGLLRPYRAIVTHWGEEICLSWLVRAWSAR
jgi:hypothetical protein